MKKSEMIDKVIEEFIKDKELIKQNLLQAMDVVSLECKDKNSKITLMLKWEVEHENNK